MKPTTEWHEPCEVSLDLLQANSNNALELPCLPSISAGFPSPAADFMDLSIDLNRELITHPSATFFARVRGESMRDAGINDGDLLIVDKSLDPVDGKIAVCFLDGEFTLKRIALRDNLVWLIPANEAFKPICCTPESDFRVWGIVVYVIKHL